MRPEKAEELAALLNSFGGELSDHCIDQWEKWMLETSGYRRADTVAKLFAYARIGRDGVAEMRKEHNAVMAKTLRAMAETFEKK